MSLLHHLFPPSKTFNGLSSLGIKPKVLACFGKHCVAQPLLASSASSLIRLSPFSLPQTYCPSSHPSNLCSFLPEAVSLCLECSADSPPSGPSAPVISVEIAFPQRGLPWPPRVSNLQRGPSGNLTFVLAVAILYLFV